MDSINLPFPFQTQDQTDNSSVPTPQSPAISQQTQPQIQPSNPATDPQGAALNKRNSTNTPYDELLAQRLAQTPSQYVQKRMDEIFGTGRKGAAGRLLQGLLSGAVPLQDRLLQEYQLEHGRLQLGVQQQANEARMQQAMAGLKFKYDQMGQQKDIALMKNQTSLLKAQMQSQYQTDLNNIREQARRDKWSTTQITNAEKELDLDYKKRSDDLQGEEGKLTAIESRVNDPDPQISARGQQEMQMWKYNLDYKARDFLLSHGTGTITEKTTNPTPLGGTSVSGTTQRQIPGGANNPLLNLGSGGAIVNNAMGAPIGGAGIQAPPQGGQTPTPPPPQKTYAQSSPQGASNTNTITTPGQNPPIGTIDRGIGSTPSFGTPGGMINPNDANQTPIKPAVNPGAVPSRISPTAINQPTIENKTITDIRSRAQQQLDKTYRGNEDMADNYLANVMQPNIGTGEFSAKMRQFNKWEQGLMKWRLNQLGLQFPMTLNQTQENRTIISKQLESKIPDVEKMIQDIDKEGKLGTFAGHMNEFMASKGLWTDPKYNALRADLSLITSGTAYAHFQGRAGQTALQYFKNILNAPGTNAKSLIAQLEEVRKQMHLYANPQETMRPGLNSNFTPGQSTVINPSSSTADSFLRSIGR